uniref:Uncharacterized protein n=1 Tax=Sipha flava TaxID=143950 RepID=A0A2S2QRT5_9HEMI
MNSNLNSKPSDLMDEGSSLTNDDYSFGDPNEGLELNKRSKFINALEVSHLKELKMYFFHYDNKEHPLNKADFVAAICSVIGNSSYVHEAENFFEQVCVEDFHTKNDVILWKQILNEIRYSTSFFEEVWDVLPFDQTNIIMHLMSHCKVTIQLKYSYVKT